MRAGGAHLTYCTNVHAGESWPELRDSLRRHVPAIRQAVAPGEDFGLGLRLSGAATQALQEPEAFDELQGFLDEHGLYVFTLNGFPYGAFHGTRVKENVYLPDWRFEGRLRYTNALADLLVRLMPDGPALEGSVSTVPGAFKAAVSSQDDLARMADLMIRHAAHLVILREQTGRTVTLGLEPEPCCLLETIEESVAFFEDWLFGRPAVERLAALTGLTHGAAEEALHRHLGLCYDVCHAAVEFEDADASLARLARAGIRIAKLQLSAGLRVAEADTDTAKRLRPFAEGVYLHQVVVREGPDLVRYSDLPQALAALERGEAKGEWRIHFHVPIFEGDLGAFSTTQFFLSEILARHRATPVSPHLEVETYTWDVLPKGYRGEAVETAIARELEWVRDRLNA